MIIREDGSKSDHSSTNASREFAVAFAAGAALLLASLVNFLSHSGYSFWRPEIALLATALLAASALMAILYAAQRHWGRSVLEGLLAALFIDLNTDSLALAGAVGLAIVAVTWWRRFSLAGPMAIVGTVVLVTTAVGLGGSPDWIRSETQLPASDKTSTQAPDMPAILHLILDEHIGLEGLPEDDPDARRLRNELRDFYETAGFAVYGGAYSKHFNTTSAIPEMLNYGKRLGKQASKRGLQTGPTEHLHALVNNGYRLTIFQSDFVDYCVGAEYQECVTYDSSSLKPTLVMPLETRARAGLIALKFVALSDGLSSTLQGWNIGVMLSRRFGWSMPWYRIDSKASSTVGALEAMDVLTRRIQSARSGDAIFAHLLLPHFPYVTRSDCSYLPWSDWERRNTASPIDVRRRAYYEQIRCTVRKLGEALQAFAKSPGGSNSVVIIHGDHGSRITQRDPYARNFGRLSDADMIAGFSTLFAVRARGVKAGYSTVRLPVSALLRDFAASNFRSAPRPQGSNPPTVYLADNNWKPVRRVPLPPSWRLRQPVLAIAPETH